jgi:hypothetical protein
MDDILLAQRLAHKQFKPKQSHENAKDPAASLHIFSVTHFNPVALPGLTFSI